MTINFPIFRILVTCGLLSANASGQLLTGTVLSKIQELTDKVVTVQPPPLLPDAIRVAEADYAQRQAEIELSMSKIILGSMDLPPDHRRDILLAWLDQERPVLKEQEELSNSIDELYIRHGIGLPAEPELPPLTPSHGELAELRKQYADNPQDLRDAVVEWMRESSMEREARSAETQLPLTPVPSAASWPDTPLLTVDSTSKSHAAMELTMDRFTVLHPAPAGAAAFSTGIEEWRDAVLSATAGLIEKLQALRISETLKLEQQTARENQNSKE